MRDRFFPLEPTPETWMERKIREYKDEKMLKKKYKISSKDTKKPEKATTGKAEHTKEGK